MSLNKFVANKARPLPVIIMADTSGSMSVDGKIDSLNQSLRDMIESFSEESRSRAEINVSVITFGGQAQVHLNLTPAHQIEQIEELNATGGTPLGQACRLAKELIEDKEIIPSRAYRPVIILLSDGHPTDDYNSAFNELINSERAQKATRFSLSIGADADDSVLSEFNNDIEAPVFHAKNASDIHRFFRAVTMSVSNHSKSQSPNQPMKLEFAEVNTGELVEDDFDLDF
ncbi:VWA domain-containing protein [Pseudoalteromonas sp. HL-AS2]|uniref:vWA domain-containing protein n=1 Tax=Pseudoalteromonas sp. HL-AS2 TaxID=3071082 RepID=UPI00281681DC|nr:VWA domain-containing protein [Pseudoalteromonas sp. HL-AS2]WMS93337.1 VWA domain-containing protein [Pseudoalteromonas sp. HL-AS2]